MVTTHASSTRAASSCGILYTYDTVMHGFTVQLTGDEARLMSSAPGVIGVYKHYRRLCSYRVPRQLPSVKSWGTQKTVLTECQHSKNINTQ